MKLARSFLYAWNGITYCFKTQQNFRIHLLILVLVCIAGFLFKISHTEWLVIILCGVLVLMLEMINTAIEYLCDVVTKDIHPMIRIIKDVTAGAVLVSAIGTVIAGLIIFLPKLLLFLK